MNYNHIADGDTLATTKQALEEKGYSVSVVENESEALEKIISLIPAGASVMNGSSKTLEQIGYLSYLKEGKHQWHDLHAAVDAENDAVKRAALRKQSVNSDYYLGSVHAATIKGEFIIASNTGSQLPHVAFTSQNLVFVIGAQKIVSSLEEGMDRLEKYVIPLENERMLQAYHVGTQLNKLLIVKGENRMLGRSIHVIIVKKTLGF